MSSRINRKDLMWLAGLLDGDGCFYFTPEKTIAIQISMIDEDTVKKVSELWNSSFCFVKKGNGCFSTKITGEKAKTYSLKLKPYLSIRRQQKIDVLMDKNKVNEFYQKKYFDKIKKLLFKRNEIIEKNKNLSFRKLSPIYDTSHETLRKIVNGDFLSISERVKNKNFILDVVGEENWHMWLAGILEAEGSFLKGPPSKPNVPRITIQMSDEDIIKKVASFFDCSVHEYVPRGKTKAGLSYKKIFMCASKNKSTMTWMKTLYPYMSLRRQQQINNALKSYNDKAKEDFHNSMRKITLPSQLKEIREKRALGLSYQKIALEHSVSKDVIKRILKRIL